MEDQQRDINTVFETLTTSVPAPIRHPPGRGLHHAPRREPSTLDPHVARETTSHFYVSSIFSGLVKLDDGLSVVPDLAESWDVDESGADIHPSPSGKASPSITAGPSPPPTSNTPLERATEPELHSETAFLYLVDIVGVREKLEGEASEISGVVVVDDRTLRITIDAPKEYFLAKLTYPLQLRGGLRRRGGSGRRVVAVGHL